MRVSKPVFHTVDSRRRDSGVVNELSTMKSVSASTAEIISTVTAAAQPGTFLRYLFCLQETLCNVRSCVSMHVRIVFHYGNVILGLYLRVNGSMYQRVASR